MRIIVDDEERPTSFFFSELDFDQSQSPTCGRCVTLVCAAGERHQHVLQVN